jgi:hypothetical protein
VTLVALACIPGFAYCFRIVRVSQNGLGTTVHSPNQPLRSSFFDRNFNVNDDNDRNYDDGDNEGEIDEEESTALEDMSIEDLVNQVEAEKAAKIVAKKKEDMRKKKEVIRRKKDKEYDAYWKRQEGMKNGVSKDAALLGEYYLLGRNETLGTKMGKASSSQESDDLWDYTVQPKSGKEVSVAGVALVSALAGVAAFKSFQRGNSATVSVIKQDLSKGPLASRSIRRDYTYDELVRAVSKAIPEDDKYDAYMSKGLKEVPSQLFNLPTVQGAPRDMYSQAMMTGKAVVFAFWRPSDVLSTRLMLLMNKLQQLYSDDLTVITVLTSKFQGEGDLGEGGLGKALLLSGNDELPQHILLDKYGKVSEEAGLLTTPSFFIALPPDTSSKDTSTEGRIFFVLEGQRSVAPIAGMAIGATIGVLSKYAGKSGRGINYGKDIANNFDTSPKSGGVKGTSGIVTTSLKSPSRMAVDALSGTLYLSDTGNHRVLQVELQYNGNAIPKAVVRKVYGSVSGQSGVSVSGTSGDGIRFNKPLGLSIDPIDRYLYIADSNNDAVRRITLDGSKNCISIAAAAPNTASDGSTYNLPELTHIETLLGKSINQLQSMTADEVVVAMSKKKLLDKEFIQRNPIAGEIVGRSRQFLCPTDVARADAFTYVSAPASHQIWRVDNNGFNLRPVFGSGLVGVRDSTSYGDFTYAGAIGFLDDKLRLAAPAGIASGGGRLFFVDSEACSVRSINLIEGYSATIVGGDKASNFFKKSSKGGFGSETEIRDQKINSGNGDVDSSGYRARTSYPSALTTDGTDSLLLCDTMNNKIKSIVVQGTSNAAIQMITTMNGNISGKPLLAPQGLVSLPQTNKENMPRKADYIVADTGNNRLLYVNRSDAGDQVTELPIDFSALE